MRFCWLLSLALFTAVPVWAAEPATPSSVRLLVPAYFYPGGKGLEEWKRLARSAKDVPIVAIANPASGPGRRADANYSSVIALAREAGVTVIGYVSTNYAKRPEAEVRADIDRWMQFYPALDGFFFDEQASSKELVPYYEAIASYVQKSRKEGVGLVVTNPGTVAAPEYLTPWKGIHVSCLQENRMGLDRYQPPSWAATIPPIQVSGLVYGEPSLEKMRQNVQIAIRKGVGFLYVTDDSGGNPWDRLPAYWELEVAELRRTATEGQKPGLGTDVHQRHWAYDFLQQLAQDGIFTGFPDDTLAGKRSFTRLHFGAMVRNILEQLANREAPRKPPSPAQVRRDVKAVESLSQEFRTELGLFGITAERAAAIVQGYSESLGLKRGR